MVLVFLVVVVGGVDEVYIFFLSNRERVMKYKEKKNKCQSKPSET